MQTKGDSQAEGFHDRAYSWRSTVTFPPSVIVRVVLVSMLMDACHKEGRWLGMTKTRRDW